VAPLSPRLVREVQQVMDRCNAEIGSRYAHGTASVDDLLADESR
jgi:hypothetical protein